MTSHLQIPLTNKGRIGDKLYFVSVQHELAQLMQTFDAFHFRYFVALNFKIVKISFKRK